MFILFVGAVACASSKRNAITHFPSTVVINRPFLGIGRSDQFGKRIIEGITAIWRGSNPRRPFNLLPLSVVYVNINATVIKSIISEALLKSTVNWIKVAIGWLTIVFAFSSVCFQLMEPFGFPLTSVPAFYVLFIFHFQDYVYKNGTIYATSLQ